MDNLKNNRLSPVIFNRVYEKWAWASGVTEKSLNNVSRIIPYDRLGPTRREKFDSFVFKYGIYVKRENKKLFLKYLTQTIQK